MNTQLKTLEQRIDFAIQPDAAITSADVAALIEETETAIAKAEKERSIEHTLSLDQKAARQAIEDATFAAKRLRILLSKLQARYEEVYYRETVAAWLPEYEVLMRKRDALAEELREVYPNAVAKVADLFLRINGNDEELSRLHQARPPGVTLHLLSCELHARGLDGFGRDMPSLRTAVQLVDWDSGRQIWPPGRRSAQSALAAAVPVDNARFGANWAQDNERRAAAQRAEQQRLADFYARVTREQEERENAEARERFVASQRDISGL